MKKFLTALLIAAAACSGDAGPTGPAGPVGPEGPQGIPGMNASVSWEIVTLDSEGSGAILFSNASVETSVVNCYTSDRIAGPWVAIAFDSNGSASLACGSTNSGGDLGVIMLGGVPGWYFLATAAYTG